MASALTTFGSVAMEIVSITKNVMAKNVYDNLVSEMRNGDLVEENLRKQFRRDLKNITTKLDSLALAPLTKSLTYLKEGRNMLNEGLQPNENNIGETARVLNDSRINSAQRCFRTSHDKATSVSSNSSVEIRYRILGCLLRVTARILETGLDDPVGASVACQVPLNELHNLPAVRDIFSVFLNGGFRSRFKKAERLEIILNVLFINHFLFWFASTSRENHPLLFSWPGIKLKNCIRTFNPITNGHEILEKIYRSYELVKQISQVGPIYWKFFTSQSSFAVSSRGEVILATDKKVTVIYNNTDTKEVEFSHHTNLECSLRNDRESQLCSVAVDSSDNVYVIVRWLKQNEKNGREDLVLYTFDNDYNINHRSVLDFVDAGVDKEINIAVYENKDLIMIANSDMVYICDKIGNVKITFKQHEDWLLMNASISHNNEIMTVSDDRRVVKIHSSDGTIIRRNTFAEGLKVMQAAFHPSTHKVTVLIYDARRDSWFSYHYSEAYTIETREEWHGTCLLPCFPLKNAEKQWWKRNVHSLPSTAVALVVGRNIVFI